MKYCPKKDCHTTWRNDENIYCSVCGTELTPEIRCGCGKRSYNPKLPDDKFCSYCGLEWTTEYLGQCMKAQLGALVQEIATQT